MNKLKRIVISILVALGLAAPAFVPAVASAQNVNLDDNLCQGANLSFAGGETDCATGEGNAAESVDNIITKVINILSIAVGVVCVIMIIIGGFRYVTSGGESGNVTSAKNTILYAIVGLVIVALAQIVVKFVIGTIQSETSG